VAADIAVPFPLISPVMVVERVIAGVVVAVATEPANPFAETIDVLVTVPAVSVAHFIPSACAESAVKTCPLVPTGSLSSPVEYPYISPLVVSGETPPPPPPVVQVGSPAGYHHYYMIVMLYFVRKAPQIMLAHLVLLYLDFVYL
jgi:hypothetical protein